MSKKSSTATKDATAPKKDATALIVEVIAGIERDLERWRARRPVMEASLAAARGELAEAKQRRDALLLPAIDDDEARRELDQRNADLVAAERKVEQLAATLGELDKRLAGLSVELAASQREKALIELRILAHERLAIAAAIDAALAPMPELLQRWRAAAAQCAGLATSAGITDGGHTLYMPQRIGNAIAWTLHTLFPQGVRASSGEGMGAQLRDKVVMVERQMLARVLGPVPVESKPEPRYVTMFPLGLYRVETHSQRRITVTFGDGAPRELVRADAKPDAPWILGDELRIG